MFLTTDLMGFFTFSFFYEYRVVITFMYRNDEFSSWDFSMFRVHKSQDLLTS